MKFQVIAISTRSPAWVEAGIQEYLKRLPSEYSVKLTEIPTIKRLHKPLDQILKEEGERLLAAATKGYLLIALTEKGQQWKSDALASQILEWKKKSKGISLLIGGPEGLSKECLKKATIHWSLSLLTFPHALVRVILAEQLYRSFTILTKHPYHKF